ncbi:uroporphyrinogen-III synthase [Rhizobium sp. RCAM05350]|nr:uroporphyrinogen-III synthase [Rhizobium sp. RCAM05350]
MGHEAIVLPLMEAIHKPQAAIDALDTPAGAIAVTSAEAIRALTSIRENVLPHLSTVMLCVGRATAEAALQFGFQSVGTCHGAGRGLATLVAEMFSRDFPDFPNIPRVGPGSLIYLAGAPRSPHFETALQEFGISYRVAEVYRMSSISYAPEAISTLFEMHHPDVVLFYSSETARQFFRLVTPQMQTDLEDVRLLCLSDQVASAVPEGIR